MAQTYWHVRIIPKHTAFDVRGRDVLADVHRFGLTHVSAVRVSTVYFLRGCLSERAVQEASQRLLLDPVTQKIGFGPGLQARSDGTAFVEVHPLPGVMDPPALSALAALKQLLSELYDSRETVDEVRIAKRYEIEGAQRAEELEQIASSILANSCVESWYIHGLGREDALPDTFRAAVEQPFEVRRIALDLLTDDALRELSRRHHLFLSLDEMRAVRDHFRTLERDPTDLELETFAQTWSEHCVHKTLRSAVQYNGADFGKPGNVSMYFENLLKNTIMAATKTLNRDWCLSVFVDNAGVIAFDDEYGVAFKVETHNHPSAIEPYGGASTGVGGCIRDILGCGLGAKPIASTDVFCLARPDFEPRRVPRTVLHPRRVLKGVVRGVADYGNRMGIPTINGAIHFDDRYLANPLVFCGCVGLLPRNRIQKGVRTGDLIAVAGGRTGRDGIHGATFSSSELTDVHADEFAHAVQIGNAIEEKKVLDALLIARDHPNGCLFTCVTDCGAGGLSSAVGEMAANLGAVVDLDKVPLKYSGLRYDEIWISESQERMVFAVPPDRITVFQEVFAAEEVETTVIGTFTQDGILCVRYRETTVGEFDLRFLHAGPPKRVLKAEWEPQEAAQSTKQSKASRDLSTKNTAVSARLLEVLAVPTIASKEWVIRQYDHEVQGRSVIKPLVGGQSGPSDAAVLRPRLDRHRGIAIGCGLCPQLTEKDPYWMAVYAVDEALRNVICVGADPRRTAILDNFCWPKVESARSLGELVRACRGAQDASLAYGLPFISGKDSLNNEFSMPEEEAKRVSLPPRLAIPGTLLISALGIIEDVRRCISMDLKESGHVLVLASSCAQRHGLENAARLHAQVAELIRDGHVFAAHDVSDGGLAVAIAEMCIASGMGVEIAIEQELLSSYLPDKHFSAEDALFAESSTFYVLEMSVDAAKASGFPVIGHVTNTGRMMAGAWDGAEIDLSIEQLTRAWKDTFAQRIGGA